VTDEDVVAQPPDPPERQPDDAGGETVVAYSEFTAGVGYPPPAMLAAYEQILPGSARRFFELAEMQSEHRRSLETKMVERSLNRQDRGQIMAFVLALIAILGGIAMVFADKDAAGLATIIAAAGGIAGIFIANRAAEGRAPDDDE
jgi:uncharacterized membrane protein